MQNPQNNIIQECNSVITREKIKKTINEQKEAENIFKVAKPKLVALLNVARDESSFSLARFFGKTDRVKEDDVSHTYNDDIVTITVKNLKDVKSHTKPFIEKLFGKQMLNGSIATDRITVRADNTAPSVTIKLTMDELTSFCGTDIDQGLTTKNNEIVQKEELIDTNQKNITSKLQKVEEILRSNNIVTATDNFLTDRLNIHAANNKLSTYPYANAVQKKGASGGFEEICKILSKQSKISTDKYQTAKNSIESTNIITDIKQDEGSIASLQKEISDLRKHNAKNHKEAQSDFCKKYHQKHLDNLFDTLKLSTEALKAHNQIPNTSNGNAVQATNNTAAKKCLETILKEYQEIAVRRYENTQSLENRLGNLKNMNQDTEIENIDTKTNTGMVKAMSIYLTEPEIKNYNYFLSEYKKAKNIEHGATMDVAYNLESNIKLKTDLETEIKSTTKQIALLITEHNDITLPSEKDKDMLTRELNNPKCTDKSLKNQALKMIDKIAVKQNTNAATSGNAHSECPEQGDNGAKAQSNINIGGIDGGGIESKLASVATNTLSDAGTSLKRKNSLSLPRT